VEYKVEVVFKMKKRAFLLLLSICMLAQLTGCTGPATQDGTKEETEQIPQAQQATWQQHTEPVTFTLGVYGALASEAAPQWGEDAVSRLIMSTTGVKLNVVQAPDETVLATGLLSAQAPDLITVSWMPLFHQIEDEAICYPLDELADQYCPDFWDGVDGLEKLNNQAADGHIYTLRGGYNNDAVYSDERIPIAPSWVMYSSDERLKALNANPPSSVEEMEKLLYAAKAADDALIPYRAASPSQTPLAGWMGVPTALYWDQQTKAVCTPLRDDAWLPYLTMLSQWYRDGLVSFRTAEYNTNSSWLFDTAKQSVVTAIPARNAHLASNYFGAYDESELGQQDKEAFPFTLWTQPLTYQGEVRLQAADQAIGQADDTLGKGTNRFLGTFITRKCAHPDRAIMFLQYLKSDQGAKLVKWGVEGEQYTLDDDGFPVYKEEYRVKASVLEDAGISSSPQDYKTGIDLWNFMDNSKVSGLLNAAPEAYLSNPRVKKLRKMQIELGVNYKKYAAKNRNPVFSFALPVEGTPDETAYNAILKRWEEGLMEIVTQSQGGGDVEGNWRALCQELAEMGLNDVEAGMTVRFTDALKRYQAAGYFTDIQP
jgi:putative aldouronate transport system substrate-binding protein